jgi:hypothetical protein
MRKGAAMPLLGRAFNALWSDLLKGYEHEFDAWHTIEHMPERIGVPGFLRGRRYMAEDHAMFILYEAAHIDTFRSPGLLARLNDPTDWSKKVQPGLVNFVRAPCRTLISLGDGVGGAVVAIRISGVINETANSAQALMSAVPAMVPLHGITGAHVGQYMASDISSTAEAKLRANTSDSISFVVLVEAIGVPELESATPALLDLATQACPGTCEADVYRLAYMLDAG